MADRFYEPVKRCLRRLKPNQADERIPRERPPPVLSRLESLPLELLQMVQDELDPVSLVCLRNTTSGLRALVPPVDERRLSRCQRWLIMCRFESDMTKYPEMVACAFCKVKHAQKDFGWFSKCDWTAYVQSRKRGGSGIEDLRMMNSKPMERYCYRHLKSCVGVPPGFQDVVETRWVHSREPTCLHCGSKPASCGQTAATNLQGLPARPRCSEPCDVCPIAYLSTYSRVGDFTEFREWPSTKESLFCFCMMTD